MDIKLNRKEFKKLKNSLSIKCVLKILLYSIICMTVFKILIDGFYNDQLAETTFEFNREIYYWCISNKTLIMSFSYIIIFTIISYIVIRNSNNNMIEIISAMDKIMNNPEQEVKLPNDLIILENRLNNIRVNLMNNRNKAKEETQKKNDLIMYMAHDLKTPLTSVIGYLTLLTQEDGIPKATQKKYQQIALDKSIRLEELTNQFFEITRYNLNNMPINKTNIDLSVLFDQLTEEFYPMLEERKLQLKVNKPNNLIYKADGDKLARAFGNLLKNAISYSYENTAIEINVQEKESEIEISFKNKGATIPEYKLSKIFEQFYRAEESRESNSGGAGLGLAITKDIIELHNGTIEAKSKDEVIEFIVKLKK